MFLQISIDSWSLYEFLRLFKQINEIWKKWINRPRWLRPKATTFVDRRPVTRTRSKGHRGPTGSAQSMAESGLGGLGRPAWQHAHRLAIGGRGSSRFVERAPASHDGLTGQGIGGWWLTIDTRQWNHVGAAARVLRWSVMTRRCSCSLGRGRGLQHRPIWRHAKGRHTVWLSPWKTAWCWPAWQLGQRWHDGRASRGRLGGCWQVGSDPECSWRVGPGSGETAT
jgi:hypothetical protein